MRPGDLAGPLRARGQHPLELGGVVEQLLGARPDGRDEVGDDLGELLLEVAVAAAGEVLLELGDRLRPDSAPWIVEQVA